MIVLLFIIHVLVAIALIGVVLLQKSEGGALGIGGGGMSGFLTGRSTANLLTRTTAVLAALFFLLSIALVKFGTYGGAPVSLIGPGPATSTPAPAAPAKAPSPTPSPAAPSPPAPPSR